MTGRVEEMVDGRLMGDSIEPKTLATELGMSEAEARELRKAVEYGRVSPLIRIDRLPAPAATDEETED